MPGDWVASGTTNLYYLYSAGYVTQLFYNGEEMTSVTDTPNANKEFNYATGTGLLSFFYTSSSTSLLNSAVIESGRDWYDTKVEAVAKASDLCRNILPVPIYPRKGVGMASATGNDWPEIIVRSTAIIACADLIRPYDKEKGDELMAMAMNPEVRVIRITDGSLLDSANMELIEQMAVDNDFQVWLCSWRMQTSRLSYCQY